MLVNNGEASSGLYSKSACLKLHIFYLRRFFELTLAIIFMPFEGYFQRINKLIAKFNSELTLLTFKKPLKYPEILVLYSCLLQ